MTLGVRAGHGDGPGVAQLFTARAAACGNAVALAEGDATLSYAALEGRANAVARQLQALGVGHGDFVGTFLPRGIDAVTAFLAILKLGAAYVPLDPAYPAASRAAIVEDCRPRAMIATRALVADAAPFWDCATLWADTLASPAAAAAPLPPGAISAEDAAYVMYTSGSTGRPKGVVVPHRGIIRLVVDTDFVDLGADEVMLQMAPLAFDASTLEIWGALLNGGRLAILPATVPSLDDIAGAIARHGVTTLWLTAGLFHMMVEHRIEALRPLRQLLAGGDVLSVPHVRKVLATLPQCRLINGYGPTENTTFTCCYTIPRDFDGAAVPVGRAIAGTQVHVLDDDMRPVPDGEVGQLVTGGDGVALGYLGDAARTAEKFIADPFAARPGALMYQTGDLVRRRPDGVVEFFGRADRQVKINGKRVELDAIEATVRASGVVEEAAATYPAQPDGRKRLLCFAKPLPGTPDWESRLRAHLKAELEDHMVPARIIALDQFPMTPAGKIDRRALPAQAPEVVPAMAAEGGLPAQIQQIWRSILGRTDVGLDDNFFDLGGTSLLVIGVHAELQRIAPQPVTLLSLFERPTIRQLAAQLAAQAKPAPVFEAAKGRAQRQAEAIKRMQNRNGATVR